MATRNYRGKCVLITGGSAGIGKALAHLFAKEGANLVLAARSRERLNEAVRELQGRGASVIGVPTDVSKKEDVENLIAQATKEFGQVDVLVNNAGISNMGRVEDVPLEDFEKVMQVNFYGVLYGIYAVLPQMLERKSGQIINVASLSGVISNPFTVPYCTSKFAVIGLTRGLRAEVGKRGVSVLLVNPGPVKTEIVRDLGKNFEAGSIEILGRKIDLSKATSSGMDNLPIAMDAGRAARQILDAARKGKAEIIVNPVAKMGNALYRAFPGTVQRVMDWMG